MLTQKLLSNLLMTVGLLPFFVLLIFIAINIDVKGNDAFGIAFASVVGYGASYFFALVCSFPGFIWSSELSKRAELGSKHSSTLRLAVILVIASPLMLLGVASVLALLH